MSIFSSQKDEKLAFFCCSAKVRKFNQGRNQQHGRLDIVQGEKQGEGGKIEPGETDRLPEKQSLI